MATARGFVLELFRIYANEVQKTGHDVTFDTITRNPCDLIGLAIFVIRSRMCTLIFRLFYLISYAEEFQNENPRFVISNVISD